MMTARPLVSIIAISFNQAEYVLDTLNSILAQDYEEIELIVCDDGSVDGTPALVERWLEQHAGRFRATHLLATGVNEGVCRNLSKGMARVTGQWIKGIACDDVLCSDAIRQLVDCAETTGSELVFSQMALFHGDVNDHPRTLGNFVPDDKVALIKGAPARLLESIRNDNFLPAPGAFYARGLFERVGGIDVGFKHLDDWPLWLRMLPQVERVGWVDKPVILYRVNDKSLSQRRAGKPIGALLYADQRRLCDEFQMPFLKGSDRWHLRLQSLRKRLVFERLGNTWPAYRLLMALQLLSLKTWAGAVKRVGRILAQLLENAMPLARGFYYFGPKSLRRRVRVFGPIDRRIPRSRVILGHRVVIHCGVALTGDKNGTDTISIGAHSTLEKNSYLNAHGGRIALGDHVHVGVGCVMQGLGGLAVGKHTMFGPYAQVYTSNHRTSTPPLPRHLLGEKPRSVVVGDNCWIGANCIVLPGARIPDESVVPAGEIVRRERQPSSATPITGTQL